jgi:hypothetical protein
MSKQWNLPALLNESLIMPYKGEPTYIKIITGPGNLGFNMTGRQRAY